MSSLYDEIGAGYSSARRTDPRWMAAIVAALGDSSSVLDVGAGTGSYEPTDRTVFAVEPSAEMIRQRTPDVPPEARHTCSALAQAPAAAVDRGLRRLHEDLASGQWQQRHQNLLDLDEWDAGFRLIVSR